MLLNCDLGESYGSWTMGMDAEVMPHIDQANIACGMHGGDPLTLRNTLALAARHGVAVGAHPSYPDLVGFGRRTMHLSSDELHATLLYQIAALDGIAATQGITVSYVKPHGALYNDMAKDKAVRAAVMQAVSDYYKPLKLMMLANASAAQYQEEAEKYGLELLFEAFADRCYEDSGSLMPRSKDGAVHTREKMLDQVRQLLEDGSVTSASGARLQLNAQTLCVHGDNMEGVKAIREIRALVDGKR